MVENLQSDLSIMQGLKLQKLLMLLQCHIMDVVLQKEEEYLININKV